MAEGDSRRVLRLWPLILYSSYLIAFVLGSCLAYVGVEWVGAYERGWRTQVAAAALIAAWFPLALGLAFSWKAARSRRRPRFLPDLSGIGFLVIAAIFYGVAAGWGGRMLI